MKKPVERPGKEPPKPADGSEQTPSWEYGSPAERYSFHDRGKRPAPSPPAKDPAVDPSSLAEDEPPPAKPGQ
ncbi:hypothetical protein VXJ36_26240 [Pseudomonas nitroreducens]|uniref:hypothetical protein n=1 Tax=Pseudomonas nitroreducens TaxID=46680 RepID=UPI002F350D65